MVTTAPGQTTAAIAARRRAAELMTGRVREVLTRMRRERARITFAAVSRRADVSRTFLYQNEGARRLVEEAAAEAAGQFTADQSARAAQLELSWRERALNAEDLAKSAGEEIRAQRRQIATLLGRVRDLEGNLPADAVQRLVSENTTLKVQLRQQTQDNRALEDRLKGARDNNRFLDKRITDLEVEILRFRQDEGER
ncbi:hypothetical protein FCI23_10625 [Actinacidiphila oryziradicis]|uniref:Transposase n=1 Tax=Actinacidiphila oryziradicis TaxID=2571141 RepID=A0A4U0STJ3_9ACTN|nr:hypothetical protein FCI23_10625 [Actinacidiphila oryziradicis]